MGLGPLPGHEWSLGAFDEARVGVEVEVEVGNWWAGGVKYSGWCGCCWGFSLCFLSIFHNITLYSFTHFVFWLRW